MLRLRAKSPLARDNSTQVIRQENLIARYNEMFARDRLDAMDILRIYSDDYENNQRIVYSAIQVGFFVKFNFQIISELLFKTSFRKHLMQLKQHSASGKLKFVLK